MATKVIHISLDQELLKQIDNAANEEFANRSEFIRNAVVERLRVVNEYHAKIANVTPPTEEELYDLLKLKEWQKNAAQFRKEWRREVRERSKSIRERGL